MWFPLTIRLPAFSRSANGMVEESPRPKMGVGVPVPSGSPLSKDETHEETLQGAEKKVEGPGADPWVAEDPWAKGFREHSRKEPRSYGPSNPPTYEQSGPGWKPSHMEFSGPYPIASNGCHIHSSQNGWPTPSISPEDMAWIVGTAMSTKGFGKGKGMESFGFHAQSGQKDDQRPEDRGDQRRQQKENEDTGREEQRRGQRRERSERNGGRNQVSGASRRPPLGFPGDGDDLPSNDGRTETEAHSFVLCTNAQPYSVQVPSPF